MTTGRLAAVTNAEQRVTVDLQPDWSEADGVEVEVANQFLVQVGMPAGNQPDGVHLIIGHAAPPVILGEDQESRDQQLARYDGKLPIKVHGRYYFSRARLDELRRALDLLAQKYDELSQQGGQS